MNNVHPVVELMLARIKSHPEEFTVASNHEDRWGYVTSTIEDFGNADDRAALAEGLRDVRLSEAHGWAMDELLNGEERRKREREESRTMKYQSAQAALQQYQGYSQSVSSNQLSGMAINSLQLGKETLSESTLGQIKKHLGLK